MIKEILKRLISNLDNNTEFDTSKRRVIKGIAGLSALAAVGAKMSTLSMISPPTTSDFEAMARTGIVEGVTFYLDRTCVLEEMKGVIIKNCKFIALDPFQGE